MEVPNLQAMSQKLVPIWHPQTPHSPTPLLPPDHRPNPALALDDDRGLASRHRCRTSALFDSCACRFLCGPKPCNSCSIFKKILPTLSPESDIRFYSEGFGPRKLLIRFHHQDFRQTKFRGFSGFLCSQPQRNCKFFCFHLVLKRDNIFFYGWRNEKSTLYFLLQLRIWTTEAPDMDKWSSKVSGFLWATTHGLQVSVSTSFGKGRISYSFAGEGN